MAMLTEQLIQKTETHFKETFGKSPQLLLLSPGRINIIGEHVDYNNGFVLPAAIDKYICFAISKNGGEYCNLSAIDMNDRYKIFVKDRYKPVSKSWVNYFLGVLHQVQDFVQEGFDVAFASSIPIGAGLSSSAALECGFLYGINHLYNLGLDKKNICKMAQKAEHIFAGVNCGIMDQFASVFGKKNQVILLDCDTLQHSYAPADFKSYTLLLLNTNVKHSLQSSAYNQRRKEVENGLAIISKNYPDVKTFRDCNSELTETLKNKLGEVVFKRCLYVTEEIKRVEKAVQALQNANFEQLGKLMTETHYGLSKKYEVSCEEADFLVDNILKEESVLGARMMGGGFGGCTINLVSKSEETKILEKLSKLYANKFGINLTPYRVSISEGTSICT